GGLPGAAELVASGVRVIEVPGAGHNVMFDRPDVLAAAVAGSVV
ncbi:alpha/beta hydrolase, partial [Streptomyces sp. SID8455]|nr:alpha/beta hydrolase [Streptomyces sp. SID8455]